MALRGLPIYSITDVVQAVESSRIVNISEMKNEFKNSREWLKNAFKSCKNKIIDSCGISEPEFKRRKLTQRREACDGCPMLVVDKQKHNKGENSISCINFLEKKTQNILPMMVESLPDPPSIKQAIENSTEMNTNFITKEIQTKKNQQQSNISVSNEILNLEGMVASTVSVKVSPQTNIDLSLSKCVTENDSIENLLLYSSLTHSVKNKKEKNEKKGYKINLYEDNPMPDEVVEKDITNNNNQTNIIREEDRDISLLLSSSTRKEVSLMKVAELRKELRKRNLDTSGLKRQLQSRLRKHLRQEELRNTVQHVKLIQGPISRIKEEESMKLSPYYHGDRTTIAIINKYKENTLMNISKEPPSNIIVSTFNLLQDIDSESKNSHNRNEKQDESTPRVTEFSRLDFTVENKDHILTSICEETSMIHEEEEKKGKKLAKEKKEGNLFHANFEMWEKMTNSGNLQNSSVKMTPTKTTTPVNTSSEDPNMDEIDKIQMQTVGIKTNSQRETKNIGNNDKKQGLHKQTQSINSTNGTVMKNLSSLSSTLTQNMKQVCTVTEPSKTKDNDSYICELNTTRSTVNIGEINIVSSGCNCTNSIVIVPKDTLSSKQERAKSEISHLSKVQIPETPLKSGTKPVTSMSTISKSLQVKKKAIAEARKARLAEIRGKSILVSSQKKTLGTVGIKDLKYSKISLSNHLKKKKSALTTSSLYSSSRKVPHFSSSSTNLMDNPQDLIKHGIDRKQILAKQIRDKAAAKKHQIREHRVGGTAIISATKKCGHILNASLDAKTSGTKPTRNMSTSKKLRVKSSFLQQLTSKKPLSPMDTYEMSDRGDSDSDDESEKEEEDIPKKKIPAWALKPNLIPALERQFLEGVGRIDPDEIFPEVSTCDLDAIFEYKKKKRFAKRASSGNWAKDRVTASERLAYKRTMGFHHTSG